MDCVVYIKAYQMTEYCKSHYISLSLCEFHSLYILKKFYGITRLRLFKKYIYLSILYIRMFCVHK